MTTPSPTPYGTPETPRISVRGEAHLDVEPETATIAITVNARGTDRRTALEDLTRRNAAVHDLVTSYGPAVEKLETGAFVITPQLRGKGRGERVRAYHGQVQVSATLTDFTALGELVTRIADLELTRVDGPWWALRPDSPAYRDARRQAVQDAVQRAREYADALGTRLVALLELADEGTERAVPVAVAAPGRMRAYAGAVEAEEPPPLDLQPQRQTIHAHVNARFTLSPPQL